MRSESQNWRHERLRRYGVDYCQGIAPSPSAMYEQFNLFVDVCLIGISRLVPSLPCSCKFLYYNIPSKLVSHVDILRLRLRPIGQLMYVIRLRLDNRMSAQQPRACAR